MGLVRGIWSLWGLRSDEGLKVTIDVLCVGLLGILFGGGRVLHLGVACSEWISRMEKKFQYYRRIEVGIYIKPYCTHLLPSRIANTITHEHIQQSSSNTPKTHPSGSHSQVQEIQHPTHQPDPRTQLSIL